MSWIKRFAVCAAAIGALAVSGATARADCIRGDFVGWDSNDWMLEFNAGNYYALTVQATASGSEMKFNNGNTWWGAGTAAVTNSSIGEASTGGSGNLALPVTSGQWYTFHVTGHGGWTTRKYLVMKTQYKPAVIATVTDTHSTAYEEDVSVEVNCQLSADTPRISPEEVFYLVYTTDGWATQTRQVMTKSGITARGTIPGQAAGTTVNYYVFSSAMPTSLFTDATFDSANANGDTVSISQFGFCMLAIANNGGSYAYTTVSEDIDYVAGNAWHCPTNTEPYASATMRAPLEVALGDRPFVRLGVNPASGSDAPTKVQLKYKAGTNAWSTLTMKPEPHGDGWQPKYDGNDYYTNCITTNKFTVGMTVQYYFYLEYTNSSQFAETSVGTTDQRGSIAYLGANEAKSHPFEFTVGAAPVLPLADYVWHVPDECPSGQSTWSTPMRNPYALTEGVTNVAVFLGNYQADTGGENMTGGSIFYSIDGAAFVEEELVWGSEMRNGDDNGYLKFWKYDIDTAGVTAGQTLRYYFAAEVAGRATTYVISDGAGGMVRTNAVNPAADNLFTATCGGHVYDLGNCWHIPGQFEPWPEATMRNPLYPSAGQTVTFFVGNQWAGDGTPGDVTSWKLHYRTSSSGAWTAVAMTWEDGAQTDWNKYGKAVLDDGLPSGTTEYYFELNYSNRDTTWLGASATGTRGQKFASEAEAQASPFACPVGGAAGTEPGYMWHAGNAVVVGTNAVQFWVKIGYVGWADTVELHYRFKEGSVPSTASKSGRTAKRRAPRSMSGTFQTLAFTPDHEEEDPSEYGNSEWWVCTLTSDEFLDAGKYLEYEIMGKKGSGTERFADYHTSSAATLFYYTMFQAGSGALTVNGLNADYTTSKFFIDEAAGETVTLDVVYAPQVSNPYAVEIFSNVGRRDFWNADIDGNGVADAIRPPSGDLVTSNRTDSYFAAIPMEWDAAAQNYKKTLTIGKCGAYRLTARYKATASDTWHYYSELGSGIRDHAVMVSPKKVLAQRVYEVNGMTAKASAPTEAGHSTFADLIEGEDSFAEFGIPYLNKIQANCLWFQPIHTSSEYGLAAGGEPGSPYAAKDYFSVSKWYGKSGTTAGALTEFQAFVAACDAGKSPNMSTSYVGTINIMLDGVFNHTSWDAVFGVMGETLGIVPAGTGASTPIARVKPGWYANCSDYGAPATWYNGPGWGNHDIACGPDRGDFGKWEDTAELFYGRYSALVCHNPDDNGAYLNEDDQYDYTSMSEDTEMLWDYMGSYVPYWLEKTGHSFSNELMGQVDANGIAYDDYGIDGLRCDFGQGLPPQFWEYCINRARSRKWNFMFMAESLDGGKVSYRSNRHFDILNESFVFAARNAGNPSELLAVTDDKKSAYNGGAVLLNLTSHDEVMPYSDPWKTASRYAMLATVKGLPMTMYGQEQGIVPLVRDSGGASEGTIVQPNEPWTGFAKFELNFGKWVADFKTWNQLTIWEKPPMGADASHGMAQLYGHVNWARASSPALQSDVQWMLDRTEGYRSSDIWAMAKAEEYGALANGKDAVLAFVLFVNDTHYATAQTFSIPAGAAAMLGLEAGESYTARNLASGNAEQVLWTKTTEELTSEGVWVNFTADQNGSSFYDDGAMVQFLKLEKYVPPTEHTITVTVGANGSVSPSGTVSVVEGEDQEFVITADSGYRIESVLADGVAVATFGDSDTTYTYTWENVTADGTLAATFVEQSVAPVAPVVDGVTIPIEWIGTYYPSADPSTYQSLVESDGANGRPIWESYVAGLDPTDPASDMVVGKDISLAATNVSFKVTIPPGRVAEVKYLENLAGTDIDSWYSFATGGSHTNTGSAAADWLFTDPTWSGKDIRFYRIQMRMADTP